MNLIGYLSNDIKLMKMCNKEMIIDSSEPVFFLISIFELDLRGLTLMN